MTAKSEGQDRLMDMLNTALGPHVAGFLTDPNIVELMLNDDSLLWIDRLGEGMSCTGIQINPDAAANVIYLVASAMGDKCNAESPILSAILPKTKSRFQGILPPVSPRPAFAIRKHAALVFSLDDYVAQGIMTETQRAVIRQTVTERQNILVIGGTGTGKTTLTNAILNELVDAPHRIVLIEDTPELKCPAPNRLFLRTVPGRVSMRELVANAMRVRPDRIIVGEVRGGEALDLLKAWNTGHPGGICTVHANGPRAGLKRIQQLAEETGAIVSRELIAEAVNILVYIERHGHGRRIGAIGQVCGLKDGDYVIKKLD